MTNSLLARPSPVTLKPATGPGLLLASDEAPFTVAIEFDSVCKRFNAEGRSHDALIDVNLTVRRGEILGVIGRSGAGKSTLLRMINGLEKPTSGQVRVGGQWVAELDDKALVVLRRSTGMIFQHFNLLAAKTALENVALPLQVSGVANGPARRRAQELLELVGLQGKEFAYPSQLSGGQKQRVGIARALVHNPDLLLCDEATSALDSESTEAILMLLRRIREELGLTIVLITHQLEVVQNICDRVAVMENGRLTNLGDTWSVLGGAKAPAQNREHALLPPGLQARFSVLKPTASHRILLTVHFDGQQHQGIDLAALLIKAPGAQLLHGGVQDIQGRPVGTLFISVRADEQVDAVLQRLRQTTPFAEVMGYVRTDV